MPGWVWAIIAVVVVLLIVAAIWSVQRRRRTTALRERFGPEYDRTVAESGTKRRAEAALEERRTRREQLDIRPLPAAARSRYAAAWEATQARFVDAPNDAVREADSLVSSVMRDRGYPMENFDQRSADISVDHPQVVENYRAAHAISLASNHGEASTEDLRQAMVHYRTLFEELLTPDEGRAEVH